MGGMMLTTSNGGILQANYAACDMLGMTEKEITKRGREGIVAKDEKSEKALKERAETGSYAGELTFYS
ncbi:MAG: PAS domain-containing protein [Balneolaceae bacterium]|nr:PAS domain-containing protein [Balneolaceae bacterium]